MPPQNKFWNVDAWKSYFHLFPDSIWALRTIKINLVYYNLPFPQNLNHWLLEKSEMINLDLDADLKKYIQCFKFKFSFWKIMLSNVCLSFFAADAILAHAKEWDLVLWKCPRRSTTLRSASTFYTSTKRLNTERSYKRQGYTPLKHFVGFLCNGGKPE